MDDSFVKSNQCYDVVVVGGGIVGLATARELLSRSPHLKLVLVEKESRLGQHQTGHNSGVIHSGIYYKPGSIKARACVAGHRAMLEFCDQRGIRYELCGKVIVALDENELARLDDLYNRGVTNGVQGLELIDSARLREIEPYAAGIKGIYSPNTGIIDYSAVASAYADDIRAAGGEIRLNAPVTAIKTHRDHSIVQTPHGEIEAKLVITCAGLYSDKVSQASSSIRIVPFRGSFYALRPEKRHTVRALIYPVPDPSFPFLGVHFTRRLDGEVWVGPNAVLAFAREGYNRWNLRPSELLDTLRFRGFWTLARKYWKTGLREMYQDFVKAAYVKTASRYIPDLQPDDYVRGTSGVRAQALSDSGELVDDFRIKQGDHVIHVQNAPSPAATSSMVIAQMIVDSAQQAFPDSFISARSVST